MTIEKLKELLPIMQAYTLGKTIQYLETYDNQWKDTDTPSWSPSVLYRVKPKSEIIPFGFQTFAPHRDRWFRHKDGEYTPYKAISYDKRGIVFCKSSIVVHISWYLLLEYYKFEDGSPCGEIKQ